MAVVTVLLKHHAGFNNLFDYSPGQQKTCVRTIQIPVSLHPRSYFEKEPSNYRANHLRDKPFHAKECNYEMFFKLNGVRKTL